MRIHQSVTKCWQQHRSYRENNGKRSIWNTDLGFAKSMLTPFFSHEKSTRGIPSAWHTISAVVVPSPLLATFLHWAPFRSSGLTARGEMGAEVIHAKTIHNTGANVYFLTGTKISVCSYKWVSVYVLFLWHWEKVLRHSHCTTSCTFAVAGGAMPLWTVHW